MADFTTLSPKQQKAIAALLTEPSIAGAAAQSGIGERTLYTWLDDLAFADAYRAARREAVQQAIARVQQISGQAVQVIVDVMNNTSAPAAVRLSAASKILDMSIKAVELEDVIARLDALERLNAQKL